MRFLFILLFAGLVSQVSCHAVRPAPQERSAERYQSDVRYLAAPHLHGRGVATEGINRAADYIAAQFKAYGLEPAFNGSYFQPFTATVGATIGPRAALVIGGEKVPQEKFSIFGLSSPGSFQGAVVFAGYGISAPEHGYDDYAGIDVRGKTVVVLRYEPQETSPTSKFDGTQWSEYATFRYKLFNAHRHGAAAVLLVTGPKVHEKQGEELVPLQSDPMAGQGFGLPMFHVARSVIEPILQRAGLDLLAFQNAVDEDLVPRSRALPLVASGVADLRRQSFAVKNVGAILRGSNSGPKIVIGAHYDHLGFGGPYAVTGGTDRIHHGADDNASGTAGVLELARQYAGGPRPRHDILFLLFTAEESGLVGSTYFVQHANAELEEALVMLNLDMIGRMQNQTVTVFGTQSAQEFDEILSTAAPHGISIVRKPDGYGPSDHAPFYASGVPVLHFWTGSHPDYHKPSDTADKINVGGAVAVVSLTKSIADAVLSRGRLAYFAPEKPQTLYIGQHGGKEAAYLGVLPSFAAEVSGVVVAAVKKKSPAEGRLLPGDQIIGFDGEPIANFYELSYFLRSRKPGSLVDLTVQRGRYSYRVPVTLTRQP